jgi:hypothetical protein
MTTQNPDRYAVNVTGGNHYGSVTGAGKVDSHVRMTVGAVGGPDDRATGLAELRALITGARAEIIEAARSDNERVELGVELRRILQELEKDEPPAEPVRVRWQSVLDVIGSPAASGAIATITGLVQTLFEAN